MREIYQRLGLTSTFENEKAKFIKRIYTTLDQLYESVDNQLGGKISYELSFITGENHSNEFRAFMFDERGNWKRFEEILLVLELLLKVLGKLSVQWFSFLHTRIEEAFNNSVVDIGYTLAEGKIIKHGVSEFDNKLLIEPYQWLSEYKNAKELFEGALAEYIRKDYPDAITKCYSSLESLVKTILHSDTRLDKQIPELLKKLKLPQEWKAILDNYCKFAHEFASRHGKRDEKEIDVHEKDVEAYLYLTGLLVRLIIQSLKDY